MREIIQIGIGQYGMNVLDAYILQICKEHNIQQIQSSAASDKQQPDGNLKSHFIEYQNNTGISYYMPRSMFLDIDCESIDYIQQKQQTQQLYSIDSFISGNQGEFGRNYASVYYGSGARLLIDTTKDYIRKLSENADALSGMMLFYSLNGATGSGLGSHLLQSIRETYCNKMVLVAPMFPDFQIYNAFDIYNSVLAINQVAELSDISILLNNQRLFDLVSQDRYVIHNNSYNSFAHVNTRIANGISSLTASERFGGLQNTNLRKIATSLIPFPRLHFFALTTSSSSSNKIANFQDRINFITGIQQWYCQFPNKSQFLNKIEDRSLAIGAFFRGHNLYTSEISEYLYSESFHRQLNIAKWMPNNGVHWSMCDKPERTDIFNNNQVTFLINTYSQARIHRFMADKFSVLFRKKYFLHHYTVHGMEEMEFVEAESYLHDQITEYAIYSPYNNEYEDEEEDEEQIDVE